MLEIRWVKSNVTHNHLEGIKGAEVVAAAIYLARTGNRILEIRDSIRESYVLNEICQETIRNAISIGGDSDTIVVITGGVAEAYYGIPSSLRK